MAMAALPRYRHQSLADLHHLVLEPLVRDRIAIATPKAPDGAEGEIGALAGIAVWASVSDEVDAKIREQIKAQAFPIRLKPEEWASGDTVWLLDVIAPSQKLATAVLANFRQVAQGPQGADPPAGRPAGGPGAPEEGGRPALSGAPPSTEGRLILPRFAGAAPGALGGLLYARAACVAETVPRMRRQRDARAFDCLDVTRGPVPPRGATPSCE
jgi:hemolysin-activating ACP:hemolysin acyltransferase